MNHIFIVLIILFMFFAVHSFEYACSLSLFSLPLKGPFFGPNAFGGVLHRNLDMELGLKTWTWAFFHDACLY